jgi:thiol-disulfide isomerase/thioredoxin
MGDRVQAASLKAVHRVLLGGTIAVVALAAFGLTSTGSRHHARARWVSVPSFSVPGLAAGQPALASDALRGRVTVLTFWASWCVPCRSELPRMAADLARRKVDLVGVNTNDSRSDALHFLAATRVNLRSGFDDQGRVAEAFGLYGLPSSVVLTPSGMVAARYIGPVSNRTLAAGLRQATGPAPSQGEKAAGR